MTATAISNEYQLYSALGYCLFMLIIAYVFLKFPPKKINNLYGYRTCRSMKNEAAWQSANTFWTQLNITFNLLCFIIPIVVYFIVPQHNILITIIANTALLLLTIPITEKHLNIHFDKEGNRRE